MGEAKRIVILIVLGVVFQSTVMGQKIVDHSFNTWWSNINKYTLSSRWYLSSELHIRRANGVDRWQQFLFRPAVNYELNPHVHLTAGYTYIISYPYGLQPIAITTPEHNVWEQITLKHMVGKVQFSHRYRLEHRFQGKQVLNDQNMYEINGTTYVQRFRYRFTVSFPISNNEKFFAKCFDELWINLDNNLMPLSFNQNWLYGGFGYKFSQRGTVEVGFMNHLAHKGDGIHYESNPTTQCTIGWKFGKNEK